MEDKNNKFDWNDAVIVKADAPQKFRPGEIASICGMTKVTFENIAEKYDAPIGSWLYTIEFNEGYDILVPERFLEIHSRQK